MLKFRIATWNTQGAAFSDGKLLTLVYTCKPDIICLQECGNLQGIVNFKRISWGIHRGEKEICKNHVYDVFYYPWGVGNKRCSMATLIRRGKFLSEPEYDSKFLVKKRNDYFVKVHSTTINAVEMRNSRGDVLRTRPMLRTNVYMESGNFDLPIAVSINNMHLISGNRQCAQSMFDQFYRACRGKYIMIGDMNISADQMAEQYQNRYNLFAPRVLTQQSGSILDFMYTSLTSDLVESASYFASSDHRPVVYDITIE